MVIMPKQEGLPGKFDYTVSLLSTMQHRWVIGDDPTGAHAAMLSPLESSSKHSRHRLLAMTVTVRINAGKPNHPSTGCLEHSLAQA